MTVFEFTLRRVALPVSVLVLSCGALGCETGDVSSATTSTAGDTEASVEGKTVIAPPEGFEAASEDGITHLRRLSAASNSVETTMNEDGVAIGDALMVSRLVDGFAVAAGSIPESAIITVPCDSGSDRAQTVESITYRDTGSGLQIVASVLIDSDIRCVPIEIEVPLDAPLSAAIAVAVDPDFLAAADDLS